MKVLIINGSPHAAGNTYIALHEMEKIFEAEGVEYETVQVGHLELHGCVGCRGCMKLGKCVFNDIVNELAVKFEECDGLVVGSPVHFASAGGAVISVLDRLFFSTHFNKAMKVGAAVCAARRGGLTATFDQLNKYFTISGMPVVSSTYWNQVHGFSAANVKKDREGLQTMRNLARNMAYLLKCQEAGRQAGVSLPVPERTSRTNFIR